MDDDDNSGDGDDSSNGGDDDGDGGDDGSDGGGDSVEDGDDGNWKTISIRGPQPPEPQTDSAPLPVGNWAA